LTTVVAARPQIISAETPKRRGCIASPAFLRLCVFASERRAVQ